MNEQSASSHLQPTPILDSTHPLLVRFTQRLLAEQPASERGFLQLLNRWLRQMVLSR